MCVSNLNPKTTEETLTNFLEGGLTDADVEIVNVAFGENMDIAVVEFSAPVGKVLLNIKRELKFYTLFVFILKTMYSVSNYTRHFPLL